MNNYLCSNLKYLGLVSLLTLPSLFVISAADAMCYGTPRAAIDAASATSFSSSASRSDGYRIASIQADRVLGQRWATITNCGHPERPVFALPVGDAKPFVTSSEAVHSSTRGVQPVPVVRAGEVVLLWRQEALLRIEVAGVSEENGGLGKTIRVRLLRGSADDQSIPEQFSGIIRGPSNVEILP
jgi:hypothetical protein